MRRNFTFLAVATLFITFSSQAQTEKGSTYIGGNIAFSSTTGDASANIPTGFQSVTLKQFSIMPSVAWAYKDNRFVGFSVGYGHLSTNDTFSKYSVNAFSASVFLRQYKALGKGFYLFGQEAAGAGFGSGKVYDYDVKITNFLLSLSPGLAYNVSKKMQLEMLLNNIISTVYSDNKYSGTGNPSYHFSNSKQFSFNSSVEGGLLNNVAIGIRFFL